MDSKVMWVWGMLIVYIIYCFWWGLKGYFGILHLPVDTF